MAEFKTGVFVVDAGDFQARMRSNPGDRADTLVCQYRVRSDPSNLTGLKSVCERAAVGHIYERPDEIGWVVASQDEMQALLAQIWPAAAQAKHPRADVIEAWSYCVSLLPNLLRAKLALQGKPYKASKFAELRHAAVKDLKISVKKHPPIYPFLPPSYFELWV